MSTVIVTGSGGLIGSEDVTHFVRAGHDVVGIENDMRSRFFGPDASTARTTARLLDELGAEFRSEELDIRDTDGVLRLFQSVSDLAAVIHTAAQPSHDWAASDLPTDFSVNANGTMSLLEATRKGPARGHVHLHLDEQGVRRHAEPATAGRHRGPPGAAGG